MRWFGIDDVDPNNPTPITSVILSQTDILDLPSFTMTDLIPGLPPGNYALRVEALEFCDGATVDTGQSRVLLNRANFYLEHTIDSAIPTLSEWGFIILGLLFSGSFIWIKRRKTHNQGEISI